MNRRIRTAPLLLSGMALAACQPLSQPPSPPAPAVATHGYDCPPLGRVMVRFTALDGLDAAVITLPKGAIDGPLGDRILLPQVVSASGARYASDSVEFWTKGDAATLTLPPAAIDASPRTATYRIAG